MIPIHNRYELSRHSFSVDQQLLHSHLYAIGILHSDSVFSTAETALNDKLLHRRRYTGIDDQTVIVGLNAKNKLGKTVLGKLDKLISQLDRFLAIAREFVPETQLRGA